MKPVVEFMLRQLLHFHSPLTSANCDESERETINAA